MTDNSTDHMTVKCKVAITAGIPQKQQEINPQFVFAKFLLL